MLHANIGNDEVAVDGLAGLCLGSCANDDVDTRDGLRGGVRRALLVEGVSLEQAIARCRPDDPGDAPRPALPWLNAHLGRQSSTGRVPGRIRPAPRGRRPLRPVVVAVKQWLTVGQAAQLFGLNLSTIERDRKAGKYPKARRDDRSLDAFYALPPQSEMPSVGRGGVNGHR